MNKISVILPNYNHATFLTERINSILNQTFQDFELIILDDASTDNSRDIIETFKNNSRITHLVFNENNSGSPFKQWAKGITLASGKWIWIAESDDNADKSFLEKIYAIIEKYPSSSIIYCDAGIKNSGFDNSEITKFSELKNIFFTTDKWSHAYTNAGIDEINECLGVQCTINNASSAVMNKDMLVQILEKIKEFRFHGDWFSYLYLASKGEIHYIPEQLNVHRSYSGSIRSQLPETGRSLTECFLILELIYFQLQIKDKTKFLKTFVTLNLDTGIVKERRNLVKFFKINKKLALAVLFHMVRNRILPHKKGVK